MPTAACVRRPSPHCNVAAPCTELIPTASCMRRPSPHYNVADRPTKKGTMQPTRTQAREEGLVLAPALAILMPLRRTSCYSAHRLPPRWHVSHVPCGHPVSETSYLQMLCLYGTKGHAMVLRTVEFTSLRTTFCRFVGSLRCQRSVCCLAGPRIL